MPIARHLKGRVHFWRGASIKVHYRTVAPKPPAGNDQTGVLLYGDGDPINQDNDGMANLDLWLSQAGYNVTDLAGQTSLPTDLSSYKQIWHYGLDNSDQADETRLEQFVTDGGGLFLFGDWGGTANFADQSVQDITRALVPADNIVDTNDGDQMSSPMTVNSGLIGNLADDPHELTTWTTDWVGGLAGVPAENTFATNTSGDAGGAAFEVGRAGGRLVDLMDVNWAQSTYEDPGTAPEITENIASFLGSGTVG